MLLGVTAATVVTGLAPIGAAVIAGLVAVYQTRQLIRAQHELEAEKSQAETLAGELAAANKSRREFRQEQVLPFLESLHRALALSESAVTMLADHQELARVVPEIRRHVDATTVREWIEAMVEMSRLRIRATLALDPHRATLVGTLLGRLGTDTEAFIDARNRVLRGLEPPQALRLAHRQYLESGHALSGEIVRAVLDSPSPATSDDETGSEIAAALVAEFERSMVALVPAGERPAAAWVALWEESTDPAVDEYMTRLTQASLADVDAEFKRLLERLEALDGLLGMTPAGREAEPVRTYCVALRFSSARRRDGFIADELPAVRESFKILWSNHRMPSEIVVD